jgi:hypothetical protein
MSACFNMLKLDNCVQGNQPCPVHRKKYSCMALRPPLYSPTVLLLCIHT